MQKFLFMMFKTVHDMIITHLINPLYKYLLNVLRGGVPHTLHIHWYLGSSIKLVPYLSWIVCVWFKKHLPFSLLPSSLRGCPVWTPSVGSFAFSLGLARGEHQQGTQGLEQRWPLHTAALPRVWSSLLSFGPFVLLTWSFCSFPSLLNFLNFSERVWHFFLGVPQLIDYW